MTKTEKEIVRLSGIWYDYVSQDHHKDKDCHWFIEKVYSYGQAPLYQAYHWGYMGEDFQGNKCKTIEEAEEELLNAIRYIIKKQRDKVAKGLEMLLKDPDTTYENVEEWEAKLRILDKA